MSKSDVKQMKRETLPWYGDWRPEIDAELREEAQALFAKMMTDYPPAHLKHITDHVFEAIQTVMEKVPCPTGPSNDARPVLEFSFTKDGAPIYLTAEFLDKGKCVCLIFTNYPPK